MFSSPGIQELFFFPPFVGPYSKSSCKGHFPPRSLDRKIISLWRFLESLTHVAHLFFGVPALGPSGPSVRSAAVPDPVLPRVQCWMLMRSAETPELHRALRWSEHTQGCGWKMDSLGLKRNRDKQECLERADRVGEGSRIHVS